MKRVLASLLISTIFLTPLAAGADTKAAISTSAPADEYFGRLQLSIIGIKNELGVLEQRIDADPLHADKHLKTLELVEDSLESWAVKYPKDSWLQDAVQHLELVYEHVASLEGKLHLAHLVLWTHDHLAGTPADDSARLMAAKFFDVPLHTTDTVAPSPDPLDPTAPVPAPSSTPQM